MKTLEERYNNDPAFRSLVQVFEAYINQGDFTPSEIRQAAILACINIERWKLPKTIFVEKEAVNALKVLEDFIKEEEKEKRFYE